MQNLSCQWHHITQALNHCAQTLRCCPFGGCILRATGSLGKSAARKSIPYCGDLAPNIITSQISSFLLVFHFLLLLYVIKYRLQLRTGQREYLCSGLVWHFPKHLSRQHFPRLTRARAAQIGGNLVHICAEEPVDSRRGFASACEGHPSWKLHLYRPARASLSPCSRTPPFCSSRVARLFHADDTQPTTFLAHEMTSPLVSRGAIGLTRQALCT